mgnify:CR=1 FL=1
MIIKTRHTGLVVKNIAASIEFYEALGLTVWKREEEQGDFLSQVVGLKNAKIETAKLKISDGSLLELLEYKSHPTEPTQNNYPPNRHGCSHISFTVNNLDKISKQIQNLGGSLVNPPAISSDGLVKVLYCYDLDGILVELVEELEAL